VSARVASRPPRNPVLLQQASEGAKSLQNRIADAITGFAGSMSFVCIHVTLSAIWMALLERRPRPTLTLAVSLEAIFLSTFVLISQNRSDARRQVPADHQWQFVQLEERQNEELLRLSDQVLDLKRTIHASTVQAGETGRSLHPLRGGASHEDDRGAGRTTGEPRTMVREDADAPREEAEPLET
jgi:uncharacterized membrane protein